MGDRVGIMISPIFMEDLDPVAYFHEIQEVELEIDEQLKEENDDAGNTETVGE